ncbi:mucin-5AC-like [Penaeus monodon]|uniref:mucin-5AC-like n=1 Tax=Penaeus monodon TaxID=6687 RepID=UPI0018A78963|nr:mucin-5AC-like [Penaeus monodon]
MARKKARVAKLSSIRPKQKLSRILQRLGGTVSYPESRPTRVTRSKVEGKEEAANEKSNEEEDPKVKPDEEKQSETKTETTKGNSPEAAPAGPSNRLIRKKEERKKFIMKRVVRVRKENKTDSPEEGTIVEAVSAKPVNPSPPTPPADEVPMSKRLRRSTQETTTPQTPQKKTSPTSSAASSPSAPQTLKKSGTSNAAAAASHNSHKKPSPPPSSSSSPVDQKKSLVDTTQSSSQASQKKSLQSQSSTSSNSPTPQQKKLSQPSAAPSPTIGSSPQQKKTNTSTSAASTPQKKGSPASSPGSPSTNRKMANTRESRRGKESSAPAPVDTNERVVVEEAEANTGVRARPSRRTKEAATVYLELIGRKLAQESKSKQKTFDEEDEDEEEDDDAISVSSIMDLKALAKSRGREAEQEEKKKLKPQESSASESVRQTRNARGDRSPSVDTTSPKTSTLRKSLRKSRESSDQVDEDKTTKPEAATVEAGRVTRRTPSVKDESSNSASEDRPSTTTRRGKKVEKNEASPDEESVSMTPSPAISQPPPAAPQTSLPVRVVSRSLRRTRSDADEPKKKDSRPSSRRASLELDSSLDVTGLRRVTRGRDRQDYKENESDNEDIEKALKNTRTKLELRRIQGGVPDQVSSLKDETEGEDEDKSVKMRTRRAGNDGSSSEKVENTVNMNKTSDKSTSRQTTSGPKLEKDNDSKNHSDTEINLGSVVNAEVEKKDSQDSQLDNKIVNSDVEKAPGSGSKSRRTVSQERKEHLLSKDGGRLSAGRSADNSDSTESGEVSETVTRPNSRGKAASSTNNTETSSLETNEKRMVGFPNKRKAIGGRRRSSNHDEAKLNEVLESVAKDFERDIDDDHYDRLEKDFMLGNKSPEKVKGDKSLVTDKEDLSVSESSNSCMDDSKSTSSTEFTVTSSVSAKTSSAPVSQSGSSSPNPNRRSANSRKLCDVVRSLQKKQAESPSTVTDAEKPTFLKDLNNWSSDKSRQVSPQSGHDLQSSGTTSAPTIRPQSDTTTSETVHSPSAPSTPENTTLISSKAPSQTPKLAVTTPKAAPAKASTNKPSSTSPTSSPITSHNPAPVVTVTSCSPALAPTTTVTSSLSNATISATTDSNTVLLGMSSASPVHKVVASASSSSAQTTSDEHLTVLPSIPVSIKPSVTVNVTNSGFSSPVTMSRVQQFPCVTAPGSVASPKAVELAPVKGTSKQLHIAPKPVKNPSSLATSTPAGQVSISVLPPGTQKQMPKPVQIAPKPPAGTSHNLPNTQLVAPQPGHMMQTQVQAQVQAIPQVQTVQAIPQPVQTLQAIPQPVQTVQTLTPPMQTVTAMPMQAVMTQSLIDPTQLVTPSSPAKIITQPIFVTSSMQSAVTYSISPQAIGQSHLPGNVSAVARVLTPTMVGKVAAKPQPHLMTPKVPGPLVTFTTGAVGGSSAVRPIVPLPQQVQAPQQPQILAVSVMPVGSTHVSSMPGQAGLLPGTQGPMITTGHPAGQHHAFIPVTAANQPNQPQPHNAMPLTQSPVCASTSASQVPIASDTANHSLSSTEVVMNSHIDNSSSSGTQSESVPLNQQNKPGLGDQNLNSSVSPVTFNNTEAISSLPSNTSNANPSSTIAALTPDNPHQSTLSVSKASSSVPVVAGVKGTSTVKVDSPNSAQACKVVENAFRSGIPGNIKITEIPKGGVRSNGPVHIANVKPKVTISQMQVKAQMASPSVTITTLNDTPQSIKQSVANGSKMASSFKQTSTTSSVALKLTSSVSVVQHKSGTGKNFVAPSQVEKETFVSNPITIIEKDKAGNVMPSTNIEREVVNPPVAKTDKDDSSPVAQDKGDTSTPDLPVSTSPSAQHKTDKEEQGGMLQVKAEKGKNVNTSVSPFKMQELRTVDKGQNVNGKNPGNMEKSQEKKNSDKKKEPLLKRTLFKTKSQEEKKPPGMSPVYRTKSQEEKKTSNAFSPLHESSVYAFEPDFESSPLEETSPFSQRIKNIQPSPGTSPVKPNNAIKPQLPALHLNKPPAKAAGPHTPARSPVARSLAPMIAGRPKSSTGTSPSGVTAPSQPATAGKRPGVTTPPAPLTKAASIGTETQIVNKLNQGEATPAVAKASEDQMKVGAECETSSSSEGTAKKSVSSTSIAIQCDMDEGMEVVSENGVRANESGTQTEGPSKFPLPPTASPFYYLPLAMAALGEKLPAQLVQQMLAKTQGLVGAAEAGMILQQAAQLAQQHQKLQQQGTPGATPISSTSAVKPIKPSSIPGLAVAPILSGTPGNPNVVSVNLVRPVVKAQESSSSGSEISVQSPVTVTSVTSTSPGNTVTTCTSSASVPLPAVTTHCNTTSTSAPAVTTLASASTSPSPVTARPGVSRIDAKPTHIPPHRPQPTPSVQPSEEVSTPSLAKPTKSGRQKEKEDSSKTHTEDAEPPARRRSGRASTSATTRATESDMLEIEELRRNRRAKRAAAALAREEGWSSSSEAPLSPQMSPDTLRGWPPPRLTSPTPSQSSEGTTSSTPSQRSNRLSSRSRRQSPASNSDSRNHGKSSSGSTASSTPSSQASGSSSAVNTDKSLEEPNAKYNCDNSILVRAPSFFPSEEEFTDPLDYIEKIRPEAEQFGLCRIVPPGNFKPECRVNDDMRFTANNQYIHKMMRRWGPNVRTLHAIKKCLAKQNIELNSNPLIGCMELDLVRLYEVVEQHGGLMSVIEKELWGKVADACRIPRSAQERLAKLDFIYCKYLLPYATLSQDERDQLLAEVDRIHSRNQLDQSGASKKTSGSSDNEEEEEEESLDCIVKGKSTALSTFFRIARNTSTQWQPDPAGLEVDERYWSLVVNGNQHVCVLSASIDTSEHGYGFPNHRLSPLTKHPWNLKNLCQNPNSILRSMGTIVGVTAPTLHVGMLFSTVCWYRDPHSLPWIEYLHTGASKIWYGVAANQEDKLCAALKKIVPDFIKDSAIWLPSDTAMVPPSELVREGVRVCRIVQEPGQFVVVFPGAFTSSVCTGYLISESAFFARPQYFDRALVVSLHITGLCLYCASLNDYTC